MTTISIATLHLMLCVVFVSTGVRSRDPSGLFLLFTGLFSIGYYVLPVFFSQWSGLDNYSPADVASSQTIHLLHSLSLLGGFLILRQLWPMKPFTFKGRVDFLVTRHWFSIYSLTATLFLFYILTTELTAYGSTDYEGFFTNNRSALYNITATIASYNVAVMCIILALTVRSIPRFVWVGMASVLALMLVILGSGGQRLLILTPLLMLTCSFWVLGDTYSVRRLLIILIVLLFIFSPIAVLLRGYESHLQGSFRISDALATYSEAALLEQLFTAFKSIVERGDLIETTIHLKRYIDATGYVGDTFYLSVLQNPIPRVFFPEKLFPLSDDGTIWGEISMIAWRIMRGESIGSLTAFGGITAYRQGGIPATIVDGIMVGATQVLIVRLAAKAGVSGMLVYVAIFAAICVKRVPASFFELLVELVAILPLVAILALVSLFAVRPRSAVSGAPAS